MAAIDLLARYAGTESDQKLYAAGEKVPIDGVVPRHGWTASSTTTAAWSGSRTSCAC